MILYLMFFGTWLFCAYRKQGLTPFTLLLLEYLAGAFCSFVLFYYYSDIERISSISPVGVLYHILILYLFLSPLQGLFNIKIRKIRPISKRSLLLFSFFLVAINIPALISSMKTFGELLTGNAFNLGLIRESLYEGTLGRPSDGRIGWERLVAATSIFALIPFFELITQKGHGMLKVLLFLSSTEIAVENLTAASRDGLFIWSFAILALYLVYRDTIAHSIKNYFKVFFVIILVFFAGVFVAISLSRSMGMQGSDYGDPIYFLINYAGKSFLLFQKFFQIEVLGELGQYDPNSFHTFVYTLVVWLGAYGTLLVALLFNIFIRVFLRGRTFFELNVFLLLYFFFSFGMLYFYYYFALNGTIFSMIIVLSFAFVLARFGKGKQSAQKEISLLTTIS